MERTFGLHIVASDKDFYSGRGKKIVLPMKDGEICILPRHSDLMIAIVPGEMRFETAPRSSITVSPCWRIRWSGRRTLT